MGFWKIFGIVGFDAPSAPVWTPRVLQPPQAILCLITGLETHFASSTSEPEADARERFDRS